MHRVRLIERYLDGEKCVFKCCTIDLTENFKLVCANEQSKAPPIIIAMLECIDSAFWDVEHIGYQAMDDFVNIYLQSLCGTIKDYTKIPNLDINNDPIVHTLLLWTTYREEKHSWITDPRLIYRVLMALKYMELSYRIITEKRLY